MDKTQKVKVQKATGRANVLEALRDIGSNTASTIKNDVISETSKSILEQMFGQVSKQNKYSAEITPGESLDFKDLYAGKHEENLKLRKQINLERNLANEEKARSTEKTDELRVQLQALMQELLTLAKSTQGLGEEVEIATMQAPAQPGIYHIIFFEKLLDFVKSFRKKIDSASVWLQSSNKRAEKKNYWAMFKKKGSSFLLSGESYSQRAAG
ncbi:MAG: DUF5660 domain-containing protein [bacterium]|nr:DUF5660 domain-containing protein [bacterium]